MVGNDETSLFIPPATKTSWTPHANPVTATEKDFYSFSPSRPSTQIFAISEARFPLILQ